MSCCAVSFSQVYRRAQQLQQLVSMISSCYGECSTIYCDKPITLNRGLAPLTGYKYSNDFKLHWQWLRRLVDVMVENLNMAI